MRVLEVVHGVWGVADGAQLWPTDHMHLDDPENLRHLGPLVVFHEALDAGFAFDGWRDLHYPSRRRPAAGAGPWPCHW